MPQSRPSRRTVLKGAAAAAAASTVGFPAIVGFAKEFSGVTINGASFQHVFFNYLKEYIPEFEEQSGMKVNFNTQAFPVYNQRTDLELSTKGSALDVVNVTFIYTGRWIGAGWVENLDPFVNDPNLTPSDWDAGDFVGGAQSSLQDKAGATYGFAWEAGAMIMGMARGDLLDKAGVAVPETFDDLVNVCDKIHNQERVTAFVADKLHHWNWIPYLMGHGGGVFKDPPGNLTPVLDTPEAAKGAEYYANLLTSYGPSGVLSYTDDQAMRAQIAGRSNIRTQAIGWMTPSRQARGQQGRRGRPATASCGGDRPATSRARTATGSASRSGRRTSGPLGRFIKWAMSKETTRRIALEKGYSAVCRRSVISDPAYRENMTLNGQDVAAIYLKVLELGGKSGYMKYRTVPIFPQVGDKINKAIERVATNQQNGAEAMAQAQEEAIADLKKAGVEIDA